MIPNSTGTTASGTNPILYVAGDSGVYRSLDNGASWTDFPNTDPQLDAAPVNGGYLPHVAVTSMSLSDGNINTQTGRATISNANGVTDPSILVASTFGRGQFEITLAPLVMPNTGGSPDNFISMDPSTLSGTTITGLQYTTNLTTQSFDGMSEESAFGNVMFIRLAFDMTPTSPNFGKPIPAIDAPAVATSQTGTFKLTVNNYFTTPGTYTIGFQATDGSNASGNIATYTFVVNGPPPAPTSVVARPA